jgi:transcriptional regulator with XRE-family HTH domain
MLNINSSLMGELADKVYRDAYVGSQIRMNIPFQIRGLRDSFGWTQSKLAEEARMAQPRISELETPGERRLTIETLLRLASAFDVALQVRFLPFSELIEWSEDLDLNNLAIKRFAEEVEALRRFTARSTRTRRRVTKRQSKRQRSFSHQGKAREIESTQIGNTLKYAARQSESFGAVQTSFNFDPVLDNKDNPFTDMPKEISGAIPKKALLEPFKSVGEGGRYYGR